MFGRRQRHSTNEVNTNDPEVGLVIQITPAIVYLYVSYEGVIENEFEQNGISMMDLKGNDISIDGSYINLSLQSRNDVQLAKERFGLNRLNVPIIEIEVEPY